ncbi:MAG: hypothetical protein ACRCWF_17290 [Beijerinckiaceae bacterium]
MQISSKSSISARSFVKAWLVMAFACVAVCAAFIGFIDPYGVLITRKGHQRPIMDINQRYMYPQVVRSQQFDSFVIGTSTSRLLDPNQLNAAFGGAFANLAMNAGTAWEQSEMLKLVQRHVPAPKSVILGIDQIWCLDAKNIEKKTFRGFPDWMYDDTRWNDFPQLLNTTTMEIAGRLAGYHLGLMPERIRRDGYEVFTPPEHTYDLARARFHLWGANASRQIAPVQPAVTLTQAETEALHFPALQWLDNALTALPAETRKLIVFMPIHISAQPVPGSRKEAEISACQSKISEIARKHATRIVDFSFASSLTVEDSNYWDPLHYRLPVADLIVRSIKEAASTGANARDGLYRVR